HFVAETLPMRIDIWPDYWAASPRTVGRTFRLSPNSKTRERATIHVASNPSVPVSERKCHDQGHSEVLQRPEGLWLHPAGRRRQGRVRARHRARASGVSALREGQKVSFDTQTDPRSGKIAVGRLEVA